CCLWFLAAVVRCGWVFFFLVLVVVFCVLCVGLWVWVVVGVVVGVVLGVVLCAGGWGVVWVVVGFVVVVGWGLLVGWVVGWGGLVWFVVWLGLLGGLLWLCGGVFVCGVGDLFEVVVVVGLVFGRCHALAAFGGQIISIWPMALLMRRAMFFL
ncbi:hypothetical protein RA281_27555, partial [Pseudomonas syringae pv. tagetis]